MSERTRPLLSDAPVEYGVDVGGRRYSSPSVSKGEDDHTVTPLMSEDRHAPPKQTTSFPRAMFLLMNAILGSGILGQSYAASESGVALFICLLAAMAVCADYAIYLLLQCCDKLDVTAYEHIGQHAFGDVGRRVTGVIILLQNSGAMTSYLVILGDLLPSLIREVLHSLGVSSAHMSPWDDRTFLMIAACVIVVLPLVSARHLGFLGYSSGASISIMIFFSFVVAYRSVDVDWCPYVSHTWHGTVATNTTLGVTKWDHSDSRCEMEALHVNINTFYVLPTMAFSFVCHTSLLPIYKELHNRSSARMMKVAHCSVAICFALYMLAGITGYSAFRNYVQGDVLTSLQQYFPHDSLVLVTRILVCIAVLVTVPLINYPARVSLTNLFFHNAKEFSWVRHIGLGFTVVAVLLSLALKVPNIENVFGAVGATTSVSLVFVLPGVFYARVHDGPFFSKAHTGPLLFSLLGVLIGITCLSGIVLGWVENGFSS